MSAEDKFFKLIEEYRGEEVPRSKHRKFKFPDGRVFVAPHTPSDKRTWDNCYTTLRAFLGLRPEHREGERREKKLKSPTGRIRPFRSELQNITPGTELGRTLSQQMREQFGGVKFIDMHRDTRGDYADMELRVMANLQEIEPESFEEFMKHLGVKKRA